MLFWRLIHSLAYLVLAFTALSRGPLGSGLKPFFWPGWSLIGMTFWLVMAIPSWWKLKDAPLKTQRSAFGFAAFIAVIVPPFILVDCFNYIGLGRAMVVYGANPYSVIPRTLNLTDPFLHSSTWLNGTTLYGPMLLLCYLPLGLLTVIIEYVGIPSRYYFYAATTGLKVLLLLLHLLNLKLIKKIHKQDSNSSDRKSYSDAEWFYLANPLILFDGILNAHHDLAIVTMLLLSIVFLYRNQVYLFLLFLWSTFLTKYLYVSVAPLIMIRFIRQRRFGLCIGIACLAFSVPLLLIYLYSTPEFAGRMLEFKGRLVASMPWFLSELFSYFRSFESLKSTFASLFSILVFTILLIPLSLSSWQDKFEKFPIRQCMTLLLLYELFGDPIFYPWHLIVPVALAMCVPTCRMRIFAILFGCSSLLFYVAHLLPASILPQSQVYWVKTCFGNFIALFILLLLFLSDKYKQRTTAE